MGWEAFTYPKQKSHLATKDWYLSNVIENKGRSIVVVFMDCSNSYVCVVLKRYQWWYTGMVIIEGIQSTKPIIGDGKISVCCLSWCIYCSCDTNRWCRLHMDILESLSVRIHNRCWYLNCHTRYWIDAYRTVYSSSWRWNDYCCILQWHNIDLNCLYLSINIWESEEEISSEIIWKENQIYINW